MKQMKNKFNMLNFPRRMDRSTKKGPANGQTFGQFQLRSTQGGENKLTQNSREVFFKGFSASGPLCEKSQFFKIILKLCVPFFVFCTGLIVLMHFNSVSYTPGVKLFLYFCHGFLATQIVMSRYYKYLLWREIFKLAGFSTGALGTIALFYYA
jgi:hypothetical protein